MIRLERVSSELNSRVRMYSVRNLGSLRYGKEYCVEFRRGMGKTIISSSTEAYFNHAIITARRLVHVGLKKLTNARRWRASQWLCSLP